MADSTPGHQDPEGPSFGRRREKWARDSAELRATGDSGDPAGGAPASPEEAALRRYRTSRAAAVALPHPAISPRTYEASSQRHRGLVLRLLLALVAVPLLVVLGLVVDPLAAQVALWTLLVPVAGMVAHHVRAMRRLDDERHLTLRGGLADAWRDWVDARGQLERLPGASQARTALAANEARMQALVLALAQAESRPGHRDTDEHRASRAWVYRSAATAVSLASAEKELEAATRGEVDAADLRLAPDGDLDALDHALETARELARPADEPALGPPDDE